jgi:tetratricopeptide (TPR) repeat protein
MLRDARCLTLHHVQGGVTIAEEEEEEEEGPDSDEEDAPLQVARGAEAEAGEATPWRDFAEKKLDSDSESEDEKPVAKRGSSLPHTRRTSLGLRAGFRPWASAQVMRLRAECVCGGGGGGDAAPPKAPVLVEVPQRALPPPRSRQTQSVKVDFTQLETGHLPARESREKEIRQFKRQNNVAPVHADATDLTEREPIFLKDKGDGFYNTGNLSAAVNAYSAALEMDAGFIRCLANRAACHLQLGDTAACIADCTKALELQVGLAGGRDYAG